MAISGWPYYGTSWPNIAILSHVSLWTSHHAEAIEIALKESKQNNVIVYGCNKNLLGCPANPNQKKLSCFMCRMQTNKTNKLLHENQHHHSDAQ